MTTANRRHTIGIFTFMTTMFWFSLYAYVPELSTFAHDLGASLRMIGLITGSYGFMQLILRIPLGIYSDHIGKRKIFVHIGLAIAVLSALVSFLAPSPISLLATRSLAGATAATWVIVTVMFSSYYKKEEATKAIGLMNAFNAVGQLVGMSLGGLVSYYYGTRYLFLLATVGGIIGLIASFFILEEKPTGTKKYFKDYAGVIKDHQLRSVSVLGILAQFLAFATAFGFVPILAKNLGANSLQLSALTILAILPAIFISPLAGSYFPNVLGKRNTLVIGFGISSILCMIMPWTASLVLLYFVQFIAGIGRSMVFPLLMGLGIENIDQSHRASAMGIFQAIYGIGMIFGPILLGFIAQSYGLTAGFMTTGLIGFLGIVITLKVIRN